MNLRKKLLHIRFMSLLLHVEKRICKYLFNYMLNYWITYSNCNEYRLHHLQNGKISILGPPLPNCIYWSVFVRYVISVSCHIQLLLSIPHKTIMHGISYSHSIWDSLLIPLQIIFPDFFKSKLFILIKFFSFVKKKKNKEGRIHTKGNWTQFEIEGLKAGKGQWSSICQAIDNHQVSHWHTSTFLEFPI